MPPLFLCHTCLECGACLGRLLLYPTIKASKWAVAPPPSYRSRCESGWQFDRSFNLDAYNLDSNLFVNLHRRPLSFLIFDLILRIGLQGGGEEVVQHQLKRFSYGENYPTSRDGAGAYYVDEAATYIFTCDASGAAVEAGKRTRVGARAGSLRRDWAE